MSKKIRMRKSSQKMTSWKFRNKTNTQLFHLKLTLISSVFKNASYRNKLEFSKSLAVKDLGPNSVKINLIKT